ncbi:Esterase PHB depolymerase [Roseimaritima multifibrata]|uniref:Esterase PHB depolymerase n=1 Tax=Roseimaritima multifibrata TaxID=1930274 RepID=A0A517MFA7_9BACT|nr:PHB depolymerase family esterase [Roseimaritima multifibrata]QDS93573.1 Esterase PHB depolymerase [Roseimaritima multifibrata]
MKRFLIGLLSLVSIAVLAWWLLHKRPLNADVQVRELTVDGSVRTYRIVVPYNLVSPAPVLFAFHGIGDSTDSMAQYSQLDRLAAGNGFILVYPAALNSMWSTINIDPADLDANPDVRFFDDLYAQLASEHSIASDRIYLAGMPNGGSFVHILATARPKMIAAFVAHSGLRPRELGDCDHSIPMVLLAGANDSVAPIMNFNADRYRSAGCTVDYIEIPRLAHEWSARHNRVIWRFLSAHDRDSTEEAEP